MKKTLLLILILTLSSCSWFHKNEPQKETKKEMILSQLSIYLRKNSLAGIEYEQFTIDQNILISECGQFRNDNHKISQQFVNKLTKKKTLTLSNLTKQLSQFSEIALRSTTDGTQALDEGMVEVNFYWNKKHSYRSSITRLNEANYEIDKVLLALINNVRETSGKSLCHKSKFYGIGN